MKALNELATKELSLLAARYTQRRRELGRRQAQKRFERQRRLNRMASPGPHPLVVVLDHLKPRFKNRMES